MGIASKSKRLKRHNTLDLRVSESVALLEQRESLVESFYGQARLTN